MSLLHWNHAMKTGLVVAGAATLMTLAGCTPAAPDAAKTQVSDEATIRQLDADWAKVAAAKNIDGWVSFYADDATVLPPNEPIAKDHAAIRRSVAGLLTLPELSMSWQPTKVEVSKSGDLAYLTGAYAMKAKDEKGNPISDTGKILEIWKKQADGKWKCIVDTWNSDLPMAGAPASK
jgi:ketosteroid isomerase-like protein